MGLYLSKGSRDGSVLLFMEQIYLSAFYCIPHMECGVSRQEPSVTNMYVQMQISPIIHNCAPLHISMDNYVQQSFMSNDHTKSTAMWIKVIKPRMEPTFLTTNKFLPRKKSAAAHLKPTAKEQGFRIAADRSHISEKGG